MKKIMILIVFLFIISTLIAQTESNSSGFNSASIYMYSGTLAGSEQLKIKAYIWGQVRNPGLYIVPDNTDLLTLISSAGGPTENAKLTKVRILRPSAEGEKLIWVDIKKYLETGNMELIPILYPGDTIVVSGTIFYAFSKAADFLSKVAIVLSVYAAMQNIGK
jgi:polysaccharide biosynthesis/export protein